MYCNSATELFSFLFNEMTKNHIIMYEQELFMMIIIYQCNLTKAKNLGVY